jgi:hypothetical protein
VLANDTDADGDVLTVTAVSACTSAGQPPSGRWGYSVHTRERIFRYGQLHVYRSRWQGRCGYGDGERDGIGLDDVTRRCR